ncbi:hypothetical protein D3OALGA1CA_3668 [Olavius algarvensis associated proteobacterium Delta 3]|nr:hypothetical protein D3OALGA1CA_3668 [Olavius algarvensis associated proteobacterium Delta 3]CAB5148016.1 hypothetical protein D3OALGB2SA_4629 [Olavius algarvensis associated proteobacterium Delta 3]
MSSEKEHNGAVSVLVCSKGRRTSLENLVTSIRKIHHRAIPEIVVVEETAHPKPIDGTRYIAHPIANLGIPFARNLALANATGQIIVFVDDDCILADSWLDALIEPILEDKTVVGTQGGVTVPETSNAIGWAESLLGFPGGGITRVLQANGQHRRTKEVSTLNCAYRRLVLEKTGGFNERLKVGGEDYLLAKQACEHGTCVFIPDALVYHEPRGGFGKIWTWFIRRGRAEIDLRKTGKVKDMPWWPFIRGWFLFKILAVVLASVFLPYGTIFAAVMLFVLYPGIQYARYFRWWHESPAPLSALIVLPAVKMVMDVAMDVGRIRGVAFDR